MRAQVLRVYDGDTLLLRIGQQTRLKLRLSRIDSPELGQPFINSKQDAGLFSKQCLEKILKRNGKLKIEGFDIYSRALGNFDNLNLKLIQNGCTSLYPYAIFNSKHEKFFYLQELTKAKRLRRGVWARGGYLLPKLWRKKKFSKRF
jgi:endonuclease YncB( thermonuclease family)